MSTYNQINGSFYQVANADANLTITEINAPNLNVSGQSNLGPIANVEITGGSNGQVIRTDGAGNLSFVTINTASISNGTSNVNIPVANGNVTVSVNGTANVVTVTATGANVSGTLAVTGKSNLGAVGNVVVTGGSNGQVIQTDGAGNLSFVSISSSSISNGNSNVRIATANGNVTITAVGNTTMTVTGTGANIAGTANITGNVTSGNANLGNLASANFLTGTLTTAAQPNITSVGTLTGLTTSGNVKVGTGGQAITINPSVGEITGGSLFRIDANVVTTNWLSANTSARFDLVGSADPSFGLALPPVSRIGVNGASGNDGKALVANASGNVWGYGTLRWQSVVTGASGGNTEVQFNDDGSFGGSSGLTYNKTTNSLSVAGSLTANAVTSNGNVDFTSSGNVSLGAVGNVKITGGSNGQVVSTDGNGNLSFITVSSGSISNGTSNVSIPAANGNVNISSAGNANVLVVTGTGANVTGTLNVTSNISYGNSYSGLVFKPVPNGFYGAVYSTGVTANGNNYTLMTDGGATLLNAPAPDAGVYLRVDDNNKLAVVSAGATVFGNLTVTGNSGLGNVATASFFAGTLTTAAQPNITSVGNLTGLTVSGNAVIAGNLTVSGNTTYINITNLNVQDPLISLGGGANGAPLTTNDGKDRGTLLEYYTTAPVTAFMGWDNGNGEFALGSNVTVANEVVTYNTLGNLRAAAATLSGVTVSGTSNLGAVANVTITGGSNGQYLQTNGSGNLVWANAASGNVSSISNGTSNVNIATANGNVTIAANGITQMTISGSNVTIQDDTVVEGEMFANFVTSRFTMSTDNVTSRTMTGGQRSRIQMYGNSGVIFYNQETGYSDYPMLTVKSGGMTVGVDANFLFDAVITNANFTVSNGTSNLGNVGNVKITGGSNGQVLRTDGAGNLSFVTPAASNSISSGNSSLTISNTDLQLELSDISNVIYANAYEISANFVTSTVNTNANLNVVQTTVGPNVYGGYLNVDRNITANAIISNNSVSAATFQGVIANTSNAQPNITSVGTLIALGVAGNLTVGNNITASNITANIAVTAPNFIGTGSQIFYGLNNVGMVVSNTSNADISTVLLRAGNSFDLGAPLIINKTTLSTSLNANFTGILGLGNVANVRINGGSNGQIITTDGSGNLSFSNLTTIQNGNSNVSISSAGGNVDISAAGNTTVTVTGTGANIAGTLDVTGNATADNFIGRLANGNSNVGIATANGNVTVTAVGNTTLTVTGTGANVAGTLNVTGNTVFTGANVHLGANGNVKITGGTSGQYLQTDGTGNLTWAAISGGSAITNGNSNVSIAANGNITMAVAGNSGIVTVTGTGMNVAGTGNFSGNVTAGNFIGHFANGNSSVKINTANGNVTISTAGNANILTVTGTGANISGTMNVTGNTTLVALTATGNVAFSGADVNLGNVSNLEITGGGLFGQALTSNGANGVTWSNTVVLTSQYLRGSRTTTANLTSNQAVAFNSSDYSTGSAASLDTATGNITLQPGTWVLSGQVPSATAPSSNPRPQFQFFNATNNTWLGSASQVYSPNDGAGWVAFGGLAQATVTLTATSNIQLRLRSANGTIGLNQNTDIGTAGANPWFEIRSPGGQASGTVQYLYAKRSGNQTIPSGTWANRDIVFNSVTENSGLTYNASTGEVTLTAGVTYRITAGIQWNALASYLYTYGVYNNANVLLSGIWENFPPASTATNTGPNQVDFIYTPTSTTTVKIRTSSTTTAQPGEFVRGDLGGTYLSVQSLTTVAYRATDGWTVDTAWTLGGTTTAPTFATTNTRRLAWKVEGKTMYINGFYTQTANAGSAAGSGEYLLTLPGGYQIDTTVTSTAAVGAITSLPVGQLTIDTSSQFRGSGQIIPFDSTRVKFIAWYTSDGGVGSGGLTPISSTFYNINAAARYNFYLTAQIPIL